MGASRKIISWFGVTGLALMLLGGALILSLATGAQASDAGEGWLGVSLQELTPRLRDAMDLDPDTRGVVVASVFRGSPASAAGLREGDVIIELDDERVRSVQEAVDVVRRLAPGKKILVVVMRDGDQRGLGATLGTRDERGRAYFVPGPDGEVREHYGDESRSDPRRAPRASNQWKDEEEEEEEPENRWYAKDDEPVHLDRERVHEGHRNRIHIAPRVHRASGGYLGVRTMSLGEQLAEYFGVDANEGVLITEVVENSPAAEAGLLAGDVIVAVGDAEVESPGDLRRLVRKYDPETSVELTILRKGSRRTLNATLGEAKDFGGVFFIGPDDHLVAIPPIPPVPDIEIIVPRLEGLERLHLDLEELEGLEGLEIIELGDLPHIEIILDNHKDTMRLLRQNMKHLRHGLREIQEQGRKHWHRELRRAREVEAEVRRELREVERERRVRVMEARERNREELHRVRESNRTGKTV